MSSYRNTHWCHQCLQAVRIRTPNPVCPSCSGGFVQELNEIVVNGRQDSDPFHLHGHDFSDHHRSTSPMEAYALSMQRELGVTRPSHPFENHITQWGPRMPSSSTTTTDNPFFEDIMTQWRSRMPSSSTTTTDNPFFEDLMTQRRSRIPSSSTTTTTTNNLPFENLMTQLGSRIPSSSSTTTNNLPFENRMTQLGSRIPSSSSTTTNNLPFENRMTQWGSLMPSSSSSTTTNNNFPFENHITQWGSLMPSSSSSTTTNNNFPFENHITQWGSLMHSSSSSSTTNNNNAFEWFNEAPVGSRSRPSNSNADDLMGADFQWMIDQMLPDSARVGPHPASRSAIDSLPTITITNEHLNNDSNCPVCQDDFVLEAEVRIMPCNHIYHSDCIVPWLYQNNSCPVCRLKLPSHGGGGGGSGGGGGQNQEWDSPSFWWS